MEEMEELNIYQRMLAIIKDLSEFTKQLDEENIDLKEKEKKIFDEIIQLEIKHGVYSHPLNSEFVSLDVMSGTLKTTYKFKNVLENNDYITMDIIIHGKLDKIMDISRKSVLIQAYKIFNIENLENEKIKEE